MQTPSELSHSSSSEAAPGRLHEASHYLRRTIHFTAVNRVLKALLEGHNNLRLRTKLLLWLVLFSAALTSATLLLGFHPAPSLIPKQIEPDAPHPRPTNQTLPQPRGMPLGPQGDPPPALRY